MISLGQSRPSPTPMVIGAARTILLADLASEARDQLARSFGELARFR
jgi:hypothetical protein